MLKSPYVSRAFGHLFDLVRLVMLYVSHRISSTARISTLVTQVLISSALMADAVAAINKTKKSPSGLFLL